MNHFSVGDRVRVTDADELLLVGLLGTVTELLPRGICGVVLDGAPTRLPAAFHPDELEKAAAPCDASPAAPMVGLLPRLPEEEWGSMDGYDWIDELPSTGWYAVGVWGKDGWPLGSWPYQIVAHFDMEDLDLFGVATFTEGDTHVQAFASREERDAATNEIAVHWWISNENGPDDLTPDMSPIPAAYCGPYSD
ncbi:hypothetical protein CTZ27_33145 [Streptomyces griseocarneus]|nr:hypothetical protein CTZ27_33145 [Streptomyces griseocarneus]